MILPKADHQQFHSTFFIHLFHLFLAHSQVEMDDPPQVLHMAANWTPVCLYSSNVISSSFFGCLFFSLKKASFAHLQMARLSPPHVLHLASASLRARSSSQLSITKKKPLSIVFFLHRTNSNLRHRHCCCYWYSPQPRAVLDSPRCKMAIVCIVVRNRYRQY